MKKQGKNLSAHIHTTKYFSQQRKQKKYEIHNQNDILYVTCQANITKY